MKTLSLSKEHSLARDISLTIAFTLLMVMAAYVRVPLFFTPVPLTLQTLVLYSSIAVLKRRAAVSQVFYLLLGTAGLPVFTNGGSGLLYLAGPTGGYLLSFLAVAAVFPYLRPKVNCLSRNILFFSAAALVVYFFGVSWLIFAHHFTLPAALAAGAYPFLPGAALKVLIASFLALKFS